MGYFITFIVAGVGAILSMTCVGWFLPVAHSASRSRAYDSPAQTVFFNAVRLQELSDVKVRITDEQPPFRRVTEIIEEKGAAFGGTWTMELQSNGEMTQVTITENGRVYNPLFRFLAKFTFGHHATIQAFLNQLELELRKK